MAEDSFKLDLKQVKLDLQKAVVECSLRGLMHSTKWLAELNYALIDVNVDLQESVSFKEQPVSSEGDIYMLAKSYFDLKEYDRCAYFSNWCQDPKTRFLHLYSRYLAGEKKKLDDMRDSFTVDPSQNQNLLELAADLKKDYLNRTLDGYGLYLYGIVLKRLELLKEALDILVEAIHKEPLHWGAWLELSSLITDRNKLDSLVLPSHWIKHFFLGHTYLDQQLNDEALKIYSVLRTNGFENCNYILAQTAIAHHNRRDVDMAINTFRRVQKADPHRLDNLDTYSNLLYVKELKVELAHLAHHACEIDKYRVETCCVIGNYYSLRSEHQKAVLYFQRALKLNPQYLAAWTLMGHEFMEMKNTNAAIQCYRQAIEVNRRDYRAWYGLGQTYEILKMAYYCIYYYKRAQQLRPNDSRMLTALGETYEKLEKHKDAVKCYYRAHSVGDSEGTALLRVAKLFEKLNESEHAANAYTQFVKETDNRQIADKSELFQAYKYLANFHIKHNKLDDAYRFAQKCLDYEETKEEGKALLRTIAQKRNQEESDISMEESSLSGSRPRPRLSDGSSLQPSPMNLSFN
ncbi:cell division cycle protein 23 homolog isoform X1 [Schistocerca piceifrons]|uniref:cell division cycle protein 23 homolog isoform X1 n=2 Tax=Schistocerca piceifrons TaxID=274613 RepID=UPI001F5F73CA|nr:cell division cycle protein 23 homolog isoform X1 [Schistocerca piceifrons]XP_049773164.1 cell division cycle protein 23 homolog isoform X1 [Schistocerca cancellata]XP_049948589.1 cell division cycle protein 23 homolog isoform X1 [Schistocerca serialis cubense]